jgi:hypothetical protein
MRFSLGSLLFAAACSSAYADRVTVPQPMAPRIAIAVADAKVRAPYDVQVISEDGETLPTYALKDRFYVQGDANERYTIRVTNPTANRVEAVVSIDGLDVIDGESGDLRKRGYIVPAYGDVRIEGFRTSLENVATFRFSSVDGSYAGQKGKARNVGVIAVAIFEEQAPEPQQIIVAPEPVYDGGPAPTYRWQDDLDARAVPTTRGARPGDVAKAPNHGRVATVDKAEKQKRVAPADEAPTSAESTGLGGGGGASVGGVRSMPAPPPRAHYDNYKDSEADYGGDEGGYYQPSPAPAPKTYRQGLGTEFGESRYSGAQYTKFVRATSRPIAIAELRYNDVAGLTALGIRLQPLPDEGEIMLRETADPFPGDNHFAKPAR